MSLESILARLRHAFDVLNRRERAERVQPEPRPRPDRRASSAAARALPREGFSEEALPWTDAVHRFALRLTRGDGDRAADLVQETFLRAYRAWDSFERGTNCRSWLFTICKNAHLHTMERATTRREVSEATLGVDMDAIGVAAGLDHARERALDDAVFDRMLDDVVVQAIDALSDDYRDVLVLSDIGDLHYDEIARVLEIPVGTVKSRLFRARRRLQKSLIDYAADVGVVKGGSA